MKKESKKKITNEGLATVVNNLAVKVDKGFDNVHSEIENLAGKIENLSIKTSKGFSEAHDKMDGGFSEVYDKMGKGFSEVYDKMDKGFENVHLEIENLAIMTGKSFNDVSKKFEEVHEKMDKGFADVNSQFDNVKFRLATVEDNQLDLKLRTDVLSQNNKGTDELRGRVVALEKKVGVR